MKTAIVIPVYNEKEHIFGVLNKVQKYNLSVVVVDDGSKDGTLKILEKSKDIFLLSHKINLGKGSAMKTGAEYAFSIGFEAVIFMDSDGQHSAKDLPGFINVLEQGYEIVFGSRNFNLNVPLMRYLGNKFASVVVSLLFHIYVSDLLCGYRAITKSAYKKIKWESRGYGVETEMVVRCGLKRLNYTEVPVATVYLNAVKGVTILDALGILVDVVKWRLTF
jgi:glycosyltransferase involved in cell wall biosynthesis